MKHLIALILMVIFYQSSAQDPKWLVKDHHYINDPTNPVISNRYTAGATLDKCLIKDVSHPYRRNNYPYIDGAERNDFFIILTNGLHFNSRNLDGANWVDGHTPNTNSTPSTNNTDYYIWTESEIAYLYLTKLYEGGNEDPDAFIDPNTSPFPTEFALHVSSAPLPIRGTSAIPVAPITSNQSPVPGSDLTLILDHEHVKKGCDYKLCYDIDFQNNTAYPPNIYTHVNIVGSEIFSSSTSFIASGDGFGLYPKTNQFNQNCTDTISFDGSERYTYINLAIPEDPDDMISDSPITFELIPLGGDCELHTFQDTMGTSHDPNYVEVLCVNRPEGDTTSTIKYHAQCMNDGSANQPNPSIEFTFPFSVTLADITITNSSIAYLPPFIEFNNQAPDLTAPLTNRVKFQFTGTLDHCPVPSERDACIAWVEFCVKVKNSEVNVLTGDLMPFDRNTNFGSTAYAIERFIDLPMLPCPLPRPDDPIDPNKEDTLTDKNDLTNQTKSQKSDFKNKPIKYCRENSDCDCTSKIPTCCWYSIVCNNSIQWTTVCCILTFLFLLFLLCCLSKKFRRSKR